MRMSAGADIRLGCLLRSVDQDNEATQREGREKNKSAKRTYNSTEWAVASGNLLLAQGKKREHAHKLQ